MARLTAQVEEMEEELEYTRNKARAYAEQVGDLQDEVEGLESDIADLESYIEWFEETYPEARTAYEAKQRLDEASTNVG